MVTTNSKNRNFDTLFISYGNARVQAEDLGIPRFMDVEDITDNGEAYPDSEGVNPY